MPLNSRVNVLDTLLADATLSNMAYNHNVDKYKLDIDKALDDRDFERAAKLVEEMNAYIESYEAPEFAIDKGIPTTIHPEFGDDFSKLHHFLLESIRNDTDESVVNPVSSWDEYENDDDMSAYFEDEEEEDSLPLEGKLWEEQLKDLKSDLDFAGSNFTTDTTNRNEPAPNEERTNVLYFKSNDYNTLDYVADKYKDAVMKSVSAYSFEDWLKSKDETARYMLGITRSKMDYFGSVLDVLFTLLFMSDKGTVIEKVHSLDSEENDLFILRYWGESGANNALFEMHLDTEFVLKHVKPDTIGAYDKGNLYKKFKILKTKHMSVGISAYNIKLDHMRSLGITEEHVVSFLEYTRKVHKLLAENGK